jgi:hypothetical protein
MAKSTSTDSLLREQIAAAIRDFPFDNYGLDDVDIALHDHPEDQEWVPALADAVLTAISQNSGSETAGGGS